MHPKSQVGGLKTVAHNVKSLVEGALADSGGLLERLHIWVHGRAAGVFSGPVRNPARIRFDSDSFERRVVAHLDDWLPGR